MNIGIDINIINNDNSINNIKNNNNYLVLIGMNSLIVQVRMTPVSNSLIAILTNLIVIMMRIIMMIVIKMIKFIVRVIMLMIIYLMDY